MAQFDENCELMEEYGRPIYTLRQYKIVGPNTSSPLHLEDGDVVSLIYSGSRWVGVKKAGADDQTIEALKGAMADFHAFWNEAYYNGTQMVSDPTVGR